MILEILAVFQQFYVHFRNTLCNSEMLLNFWGLVLSLPSCESKILKFTLDTLYTTRHENWKKKNPFKTLLLRNLFFFNHYHHHSSVCMYVFARVDNWRTLDENTTFFVRHFITDNFRFDKHVLHFFSLYYTVIVKVQNANRSSIGLRFFHFSCVLRFFFTPIFFYFF